MRRNSKTAITIAAALTIAVASGAARAQPTATPAAASSATAPQIAADETLKPGTIIGAENADQYARYIPGAGKFALQHGFHMRIIPQRRVEWSEGFRHATEKYSGQVVLDAEDNLQHYVAGMPFPLIDIADPRAAVKIAYNWHMGPFMPDDFSIAPWSSNGYAADPANAAKIVPKDDTSYACEQFDFLRFAHRTEVEPRPTIGENAMGVEWKARCNRWIGDLGGGTGEGAGIWIRYLDPRHPDEFFSFNEASRRVRRTAVNLAYPNEQCRGCHQPFWAYALPKTELYSYKLLGTTTLLACLGADNEPAGFTASGDATALGEEPFELRAAYIIQMTPRFGEAAVTSTSAIVYVDSEVYVWLAAEFYAGGTLTASSMPLWRMRPSPAGGSLFDLAGSFYHPEGAGSFFRSLVPAHSAFKQTINAGVLGSGDFMPERMGH